MPAAAVIPAPVAYIKIVAVKKLVVGFLVFVMPVRALWVSCIGFYLPSFQITLCMPLNVCKCASGSFTLKKLECLKQAYAMNTLAWNNDLGLLSFCWFSRTKVMIDRDSWGC